MYAVLAVLSRTTTDGQGNEWRTNKHLPTFYLNENVQGILNEEGAERVARSILDPFGEMGDRLMVGAVKV